MEETLVLPESRDTVRELVLRTARELGLEAKIAFEVRSIPVIKNLVLRGTAAGVLPYGSVLEEVRAGRLDARPIVTPALRRILYLASSNRRKPLKNELALTAVIRASLRVLLNVAGPPGHPLPPLDPPPRRGDEATQGFS